MCLLASGCSSVGRSGVPVAGTGSSTAGTPDSGAAVGWAKPRATASAHTGAEVSIVAQAVVARVAIYASRGGGRPRQTLTGVQPSGTPLVFLVREVHPGWLRVLLPVRPNGSSGWIRAGDVRLSHHEYRIVVAVGAHTITVYRGTSIIDREPVGVGRRNTPTPGGTYYTKELLRPPNPNGAYGPYAYGLSGYSTVLTNFNGGDGVIGIHGTNDPASLGRDVSHGCIRMSNTGITRLAKILPLGVPVQITP
jgi:lipoprotein-anchoring transpeptidase ErfK/SrfK